MKYITFLLLILISSSNAFEVDIHLADAKRIVLAAENVSIIENNSPFPHQFYNEVTIDLSSSRKNSGFQIEVTDANIYPNIRIDRQIEYKWIDKGLKAVDQSKVFIDTLFKSESDANLFCFQNDISFKEIKYVTLESNSVSVFDSQNEVEMELPIECVSAKSIKLNETGYSYNGKFIINYKDDKLQVLNRLDLEKYVNGVVPNEIGSDAPLEALKAQAVAARTQTIFKMLVNRHKNDGYTLCSKVHCQVYRGIYRQNKNTTLAVDQTKSEILTYLGKPIDAVYSSCCGGRTESNQYVWKGRKIDYLQSRVDGDHLNLQPLKSNSATKNWINSNKAPFCKPSKDSNSWQKRSYKWEKSIDSRKLAKLTGVSGITDIKVLSRGESGRANKIEVIGRSKKIIEGEYKIRKALGGLPSSLFYVKKRNPFIFVGKGSGHGVGLCQMGTINQAKIGKKYDDIVRFYFNSCDIRKLMFH
jgi:SpoIID/LytB domain protein